MFGAWIENWKAQRAVKQFHKSPLGLDLHAHTFKYFNEIPRLRDFEQKTKINLVNDFYAQVFQIARSENPFMALREKITGVVLEFAAKQVLCLTEEEKAEQPYKDCEQISGSLWRYIDKAVEHDKDLKEVVWKDASLTKEDLVSFCNTRCCVLLYYMNGYNIVRRHVDDYDADRDWLHPFLQSMLIWEEDTLRSKMDLPSLIPEFLGGIKHSTFMNMVVNGHKNPYFEWETHWAQAEPIAKA